MIALHILKLLEQQGFGTIDTSLFFEEAPIDKDGNPKEGMWIVERGSPVTRFKVGIQAFDLYARYTSKTIGYKQLENVLDYLQEAYGTVCTLPTVAPHSTTIYSNVTILPTSGVENVGTDENNKIVRVISGEVRYERN